MGAGRDLVAWAAARHERDARMRRYLAAIAAVTYWLALTTWISVLVSAGVAAAAVFSVLPRMGVTIERFAGFDHAEHGRIAAGKLMEPIFTFVDIAQAAAMAL